MANIQTIVRIKQLCYDKLCTLTSERKKKKRKKNIASLSDGMIINILINTQYMFSLRTCTVCANHFLLSTW